MSKESGKGFIGRISTALVDSMVVETEKEFRVTSANLTAQELHCAVEVYSSASTHAHAI